MRTNLAKNIMNYYFVKIWKKVKGNYIYDKIVIFNKSDEQFLYDEYKKDRTLFFKDYAKSEAEILSGGHNSAYIYGFDEIENPTKDQIAEVLTSISQDMSEHASMLRVYYKEYEDMYKLFEQIKT